uniref:Lysophosphatidylcholine acyltransferase 2 n=1 Tax=Callorhinchus milii TaxID=7868 RepID=A0A4W3JYC0_CALMI
MAGSARVFALPRQNSLYPPPVPNPFVHEFNFTLRDKAKIALASVTLLPVRLLCIGVILLLSLPVSILGSFYCQESSEPIAQWKRSVIQYVLTCLGRAFLFCIGFIQIKVKGKRAKTTDAPVLVVAPHTSFYDGIVNIVAGMPSIVSRSENVHVPFFGSCLRCIQPVLVSRLDPDSKKKTVEEITKRATSQGKWPQLLIFPEGTCTNGTCLITFKSGAFIPGVPVQPVVIRYPNRIVSCLVSFYFNNHAFAICNVLVNECIFSKLNDLSPMYLAFFRHLELPVTDHTFEDCRLMISAGELTLPMEAGLVEFTKISRKLNLKWDNIRKQLDSFAIIANKTKGGKIGIEEFASHLKLPVTGALRELFALFDRDDNGSIDFREYVIGLTVLCTPANTEDTLKFAFKLFDLDEDGYITENEFSSLLRSALGVADLDVSKLFSEIVGMEEGKVSYDVFRDFSLKHPEYAKLFTTYLELQRYHALEGDMNWSERPSNRGDSSTSSDTSGSEKKKD